MWGVAGSFCFCFRCLDILQLPYDNLPGAWSYPELYALGIYMVLANSLSHPAELYHVLHRAGVGSL